MVGVKTILRKLLTPFLEAQAVFNVTTVRVMAQLRASIGTLDRQHAEALQATTDRLEALERVHAELRTECPRLLHGR